jgi:hypothetical protein
MHAPSPPPSPEGVPSPPNPLSPCGLILTHKSQKPYREKAGVIFINPYLLRIDPAHLLRLLREQPEVDLWGRTL